MPSHSVIESFLAELDRELRVPARTRRRVLAEAEDHLREAAGAAAHADRESHQAAQQRAIEAFGPAALVARGFAEQCATTSARQTTRRGALLLVCFIGLCELLSSSFVQLAGGWVNDEPGGLLVWLTGQVALVAGIMGLARGHATRIAPTIDTTRMSYLARSQFVVACCAAPTVLIGLTSTASQVLGSRATLGAIVLTGGLGIVALLAIRTAMSTRRTLQRLRALDAGRPASTGGTALEDLAAWASRPVVWAISTIPALAIPAGVLGDIFASLRRRILERAPWIGLWVDLTNRPWRFAILVATAAGLTIPAFAIANAAARGALSVPDADALVRAALASAVMVTGEASLVLVCFATLGRFLGLRPSPLITDA